MSFTRISNGHHRHNETDVEYMSTWAFSHTHNIELDDREVLNNAKAQQVPHFKQCPIEFEKARQIYGDFVYMYPLEWLLRSFAAETPPGTELNELPTKNNDFLIAVGELLHYVGHNHPDAEDRLFDLLGRYLSTVYDEESPSWIRKQYCMKNNAGASLLWGVIKTMEIRGYLKRFDMVDTIHKEQVQNWLEQGLEPNSRLLDATRNNGVVFSFIFSSH